MNGSNTPAPFASVRASRDLTLTAFVGAVLVAFALSAGAFLPRLSSPESAGASAVEAASPRAAPAVVARRPAVARASSAADATSEPCPAPRG